MAIARTFPWKHRTFVDVGTAQGDLAAGFDYTGAECSNWMKAAGFSATRVEHLVGSDSMVVGIK